MTKHDNILRQARARMKEAMDADRENRREDLDDLEKLVGLQWPEEIKRERDAENKPCLTLNRLPQTVRQVTGDIRRMNPAINIIPADDEATADTAEIIEGLVRHIEYRSDASSVYEQTAENAAACSIGWFRILTEWESPDSFDQEIRIKRIRNVFSVYSDPAAEMPTREDQGYCFITSNMSADEFAATYPNASTSSFDRDAETDGIEDWREGDDIVVAEYYWKEPVERTIVMLADGRIVDKSETVAPMFIIKERKVDDHKIMWAKINGTDVLEGPIEQPCRTIPVIAVTGEEWHVASRVYRSSVIRYAKDAQQMYNYWRSSQVEFASLQPKAPYLITAKQVAGLETFWNEANTKNRPYLPYNPDPNAPPPQRATPPISSQAMFEQVAQAAEDIKATTGIYDAALGQRSNETSGVAIRQRQMESDVSTSIYADNMAKAITCAGRIIVEMIPKIYDTPRILRIVKKDGEEQQVPVNGRVIQDGQEIPVNDLRIGRYDVRVSVGPNYSTRRQEVAEGMLGFIQAVPGAASVTSDLIAKAMDWPDADQFAERLKKMLPPGVADDEDQDPRLLQMAQQIEQLQGALQQVQQQPEFRKAQAEATEAEADAQKAGLEVMDTQLELAAKSGQLNAAIGQIVQQEVARALQSLVQGQSGPRPFM